MIFWVVFEAVFSLFFALLLMLLVHELGHYFMAVKLGYEAKFYYLGVEVQGNITPEHDLRISWGGFISGLAIVVMYLLSNNIILGISLLCIYLVGCKSDLKTIFKIINKTNKVLP